MDVQNLRDNYPLLIKFLEENGYSKGYILRFKCEINYILYKANLKRQNSYVDIYLAYAKTTNSVSYLKNKRNILSAIERFDLEGIYPCSSHRNHFLVQDSYDLINEEFRKVIDIYREIAGSGGKKVDTIYTESHNAITFLLTLQHKGFISLGSITEKAVLDVFYNNGQLCLSCSYKKNIAAVFKTCIPFFPDNNCAKVLSYLPALRSSRKNIQYLTKSEVSDLKSALTHIDSPLSLRDKAIGLLALYTGLRSCDLASLTLTDIDWINDLIQICQQKTGVPLQLPLSTTVGNAIYEYLLNERPVTQCQEVFISESRSVTRLKSASLYNISKKIMMVANIRTKPGERKGFHIFRHHLAVSLLENGVPQPIISQTMGHCSPSSLDPYLSADFGHLKECALSVECFPLRKEVFS